MADQDNMADEAIWTNAHEGAPVPHLNRCCGDIRRVDARPMASPRARPCPCPARTRGAQPRRGEAGEAVPLCLVVPSRAQLLRAAGGLANDRGTPSCLSAGYALSQGREGCTARPPTGRTGRTGQGGRRTDRHRGRGTVDTPAQVFRRSGSALTTCQWLPR